MREGQADNQKRSPQRPLTLHMPIIFIKRYAAVAFSNYKYVYVFSNLINDIYSRPWALFALLAEALFLNQAYCVWRI